MSSMSHFFAGATSLRFHQPPPSDWNNAAVSGVGIARGLRLHQSDQRGVIGVLGGEQPEIVDGAELQLAAGDFEACEGSALGGVRRLQGRERGCEGLELSQYRFTRVVKLYDRVHKLAGQPRYGRFFAEADQELADICPYSSGIGSCISVATAPRSTP
jgi:hypothetical protein